jgi:hypothetical protein
VIRNSGRAILPSTITVETPEDTAVPDNTPDSTTPDETTTGDNFLEKQMVQTVIIPVALVSAFILLGAIELAARRKKHRR